MKLNFPGNRFFLMLLVLSSGMAFAQVTVGCPGGTPGAFNSLNSAIFSSPDGSSFLVSGTCTENVNIQGRSNLQFFGNPTATIQSPIPDLSVMTINASNRIVFTNTFIFSGGQGLQILNSTSVLLQGITAQNSAAFGISTSNSQVSIFQSTITANTRTGLVVVGGTFSINGAVSINNNSRLGVSVSTAHFSMNDGFGPNFITHNGLSGIQIFGTSEGDFSGDNEITSNNTTNATGQFGLLAQSNSGITLDGGSISNNSGIGVVCDVHSECTLGDVQINGNTGGGVQITEHSAGVFGNATISNNTGTGVLVEQGSSLTTGGDTIANNTGDGLILNTLSALKFFSNDVMTASPGNLTLNCNNGSFVDGDVTIYKPKKCGAQFQAVPIH